MKPETVPWALSDGDLPRGQSSQWQVTCPRCGVESQIYGVSDGVAACPACRTPLVPNLPAVIAPPPLVTRGRPPQDSLVPARNLGFGTFVLGLVTFLVFGPLGLLVLAIALSRPEPRGKRDSRGSRNYTRKLTIEKAWVDLTRHAGRRGLVIQYQVATSGLIHKQVEVAVRLRDPSGRYLPTVLRRYRGDHNEVLLRHITRPLTSQGSRFPRLWLFLPVRALPIPTGARRVTLTVEAVFFVDRQVLAENVVPFTFVPTADDFNLELPAQPTSPDEVLLLEDEGPGGEQEITCGVCGDSLTGFPTVRCNLCETVAHRDCWEYLGGCSTYACEGRAESEATG